MGKTIGRPRSCDCGTCKKCKGREAQARWYAKQSPEKRRAITARRDQERQRARDRVRNKSPERLAHLQANSLRWREAHPERASAHRKVAYALRTGKLVRKPCEVCGAEKVHGHHDDYTKPLEVRWLCALHHAAAR